jgi:DnaJ-class molecular chaperone
VDRSAEGKTIKAAYMDLVRRYHPDKSGADTGALFNTLTEAFSKLRDKKTRHKYDVDMGFKQRSTWGS